MLQQGRVQEEVLDKHKRLHQDRTKDTISNNQTNQEHPETHNSPTSIILEEDITGSNHPAAITATLAALAAALHHPDVFQRERQAAATHQHQHQTQQHQHPRGQSMLPWRMLKQERSLFGHRWLETSKRGKDNMQIWIPKGTSDQTHKHHTNHSYQSWRTIRAA